MQPITFDTFLFEAFSQLSGGLITDLKTMLLGLLLLGMILIGADMLFEKLQVSFINLQGAKHLEKAGGYLGMRNASGAGSAEYEYYNALYKAHLGSSVAVTSKTGKVFSADESINHGGAGFDPLYDAETETETSERHEIDFPQDYTFIGNDVFYGAQYSSGDHEIDFDDDLESPGLYQKHIRDKYL